MLPCLFRLLLGWRMPMEVMPRVVLGTFTRLRTKVAHKAKKRWVIKRMLTRVFARLFMRGPPLIFLRPFPWLLRWGKWGTPWRLRKMWLVALLYQLINIVMVLLVGLLINTLPFSLE